MGLKTESAASVVQENPVSRPAPRAERMLDMSIRWHPLLDFALKVLGVTWVVMSFASSVLLNDLLGLMGQTAVPIDLTGSWGSLMLVGGILTGALTAVCAVFTSAHPLMAGLHHDEPIATRTRWIFFAGGLGGTIAMAGLATLSIRAIPTLVLSAAMGCGVGLLSSRLYPPDLPEKGQRSLPIVIGAWTVIATLGSAMFVAQVSTMFALRHDAGTALLMSAPVAVVPQLFCFGGSRMRFVGFVGVVIGWLVMFVSPGHRAVILLALHTLNLGGGVPASAIVSAASSRICNLGTAERQVLYHSAVGCTKKVALKHLEELSRIASPTVRGELVACWRLSVRRSREGCMVETRP